MILTETKPEYVPAELALRKNKDHNRLKHWLAVMRELARKLLREHQKQIPNYSAYADAGPKKLAAVTHPTC